jgi:hypothetical protein
VGGASIVFAPDQKLKSRLIPKAQFEEVWNGYVGSFGPVAPLFESVGTGMLPKT